VNGLKHKAHGSKLAITEQNSGDLTQFYNRENTTTLFYSRRYKIKAPLTTGIILGYQAIDDYE
jgi:hypothetical protein